MTGPVQEILTADPAIDLSAVNAIVQEHIAEPGRAIPILQAIQRHYRYLPREALIRVCALTDIPPAQIAGIASFYAQFRLLPVGRHLVSVCHGTACHVAGADAVTESVRRHLRIHPDQDTDPERLFTVQKVGCLGCCTLAPVMRIDDQTLGHVTRESAPAALQDFLDEEAHRSKSRPAGQTFWGASQDPDRSMLEIRIGLGSCCVASGSQEVRERVEKTLRSLNARADVRCGGCVGMCHRVPLIEFVRPDGPPTRYGNVTPESVPAIFRREIRPKGWMNRARSLALRARDIVSRDEAWADATHHEMRPDHKESCDFLSRQRHIVLEGCGEMDPVRIEEYEARGGFRGLEKALKEMSPERVIQTVQEAGLRGRGGAGFPTGLKWAATRNQPRQDKVVVMNGDEGDPGAFMDRMLLESYPFRVLEGIAIAAYAVGASEGVLYIRAEYPLALQRVREALRKAQERGVLGPSVLGTSVGLDLRIMEGAGAFVCGEETGLLASIEGRRGTPRFRPPFPAESGLWGRPTSINNVETYATVPWILRNGAEAFSAMGTATSKGTKVFALAGRVRRAGLIEVPMGITLGEIVNEIGGGVGEGHTFKAVQIGGPSGGCVPSWMADVRIDYEEITKTGAIMGSGGLVVMDERTCMVDIARFFLQFTQNESCGKCTFCRIGTRRMLEILERLCEGHGHPGDLALLEELANQVKGTSLCGLGQTAPNPVLTTLKYFREEVEAHIRKRCPAKRCRALIRYDITDRCVGCTLCSQHCPAQAIPMRPYERHVIDQERCVRCGACRSMCPEGAIEVE